MTPTEHSYKQYDIDLEAVRTRVLEMGGLVEAQILAAVDAFVTGDVSRTEQVIADDRRVNSLEVAIDDECTHIIARRQPAAGDLRMIMAISKIVTDLERMGDEAAKIARISGEVYRGPRPQALPLADVRHAGTIAVGMLRKALDAFARQDSAAAGLIGREDAAIDDEFRSVVRQLITFMMEDPRTISAALDTMWIAKSVERIGDHAKNVAEQVIYMVEGTDVRHAGREDIGRVAANGPR